MRTLTKDQRHALYELLSAHFGAEWSALNDNQRELIALDAADAYEEDACTVREYQQRIGAGNLASYVRCQEGRWPLRWLRHA